MSSSIVRSMTSSDWWHDSGCRLWEPAPRVTVSLRCDVLDPPASSTSISITSSVPCAHDEHQALSRALRSAADAAACNRTSRCFKIHSNCVAIKMCDHCSNGCILPGVLAAGAERGKSGSVMPHIPVLGSCSLKQWNFRPGAGHPLASCRVAVLEFLLPGHHT